MQKEIGRTYYQIKKFPTNFQKAFDKNGISYDSDFDVYTGHPRKESIELNPKWITESGVELFQQIVDAHEFKTSYYSVKFKLKFFSPNDMRPETSNLSAR